MSNFYLENNGRFYYLKIKFSIENFTFKTISYQNILFSYETKVSIRRQEYEEWGRRVK